MATQPQLWRLSRLRSIKSDPNPLDPLVFEVPQFQRSLVWPTPKRQGLIESILSGYPVGALLLSDRGDRKAKLQDGSEIDAPAFGIVDGLQRANTICDHLIAPLAEVTASVLDPAQILAVGDALRATFPTAKIEDDVLSAAVVEWLHEVEVIDRQKYEWSKLISAICDGLKLPETTKAQDQVLSPLLNSLLDSIEKRVDIAAYEIPVLIYNGPERDLPDIFELINTKGTILSKYEIFAAAWMDKRVHLSDAPIRRAINSRYAKLESEGYTVLRDKAAGEVSLFEYLFGLSQVLGTKFPRLFSSTNAAKAKASSAFPLVALLLGLRVEDMADIPSKLKPDAQGLLQVDDVTRALLAAVQAVDTALSPFLSLKLTKESTALAHGELQMVSICAATAAHLFDRTSKFKARPGRRADKVKKLNASLPQHYLLDILRETWRGPLYTYAFERVWDGSGSPSPYYMSPPGKDVWDKSMSVWLSDQTAQAATRRPNVSAVDKVVLKFLYSKKISVHDQAKYEFDVEHMFPVDRLLKLTVTKGLPGWPIGALGNLCLLEKSVNRKKQSETVWEFFTRARNGPTAGEQKEIKKLLLCQPEETEIPRKGGKDVLTQAAYLSFVRKRWRKVQRQLYANLGVQ